MKEIVAYAPGRVELLGNHTDYNQGYVLAGAINYGVTITGKANGSDRIRLTSRDFPETVSLEPTVEDFEKIDRSHWYSYPCGVLREFLAFCPDGISGFDADYDSNLPVGAGLSSSAALEMATAKFLEALTGKSLEPLELAKIGCRAENDFVGVSCGLLDQISSVFGKESEAIYIDCQTLDVQNIAFPADSALIVCHSGVKHALTGGEYNERRKQCFDAARKLGVDYLREISSKTLEDNAHLLAAIETRRARHIVGENERVQNGLTALRSGNVREFGKLMFESHESSRVNFENSTPELDVLVKIASQIDAIYGSRLTGGGFGGATVSLVDKARAEEAAKLLADHYQRDTGNVGKVYLCELSIGARIL